MTYNTMSLNLRSLPAKRHATLLNGFSSVHECDRRQADRRTTLHRNVWE